MFPKAVLLFLRLVLASLILEMTGGPYVFLQTVAWTRMVVTYSKTTSVQDALKDTFDGQHPCELCKTIQKAQQTEKKSNTPQVSLKQEFFCQSHGEILLNHPHHCCIHIVTDVNLNTRSEPPPVPPPRGLLG